SLKRALTPPAIMRIRAMRSTAASFTTSSREPAAVRDAATRESASVPGAPTLLPLVRLLQLASPALPLGADSYSQGLEQVVEDGVVDDAQSAERWIGDALEWVVARGEAAMSWRLLIAARDGEWSAFVRWNAWFRASRESSELRAETEQMGASLA